MALTFNLSGGLCTLVTPYARPFLSVTTDKSEHWETGNRYGYYGETIGSHHRATRGTHLQPSATTPKLEAHNPQSKLASQIAVKFCQIQRWFVPQATRTYHRPTQQYHRQSPYRAPLPQNGCPPHWGPFPQILGEINMPSISHVVLFPYFLVYLCI